MSAEAGYLDFWVASRSAGLFMGSLAGRYLQIQNACNSDSWDQ